MSISQISKLVTDFSGNNLNQFSQAVTAVAGDLIVVSVTFRNVSTMDFGIPTWNGQTMVHMGSRIAEGDAFTDQFYVIANASATANVVSAVSPVYAYTSGVFLVYRSTLGWAGTPATLTSQFYNSGGYVAPSLSTTLSSTKLAISILNGTAWDVNYSSTASTTWAPSAPAVLIGSVNNVAYAAVYRTYVAELTGNGTTTAAWVATGGQPRYTHSLIVLQESAIQINNVNTTNSVSLAQVAAPFNTAGFTGTPVASTDTPGISVGTLTGTLNNWTAEFGGHVEGGAKPSLPTTVLVTLTNGAEVASKQVLVGLATNEVKLVFDTPILDDTSFLTGLLFAAGRTVVTGDEFYYIPYGNLVIKTDGEIDVSSLGTFSGWLRVAATGLEYQYTITVKQYSTTTVLDLTTLLPNSTSPRFDGLFPLGNRP